MSTYRPTNSTVFVYDFVLRGVRYRGSTGCKTKRDADAFEARERARVQLAEKGRLPEISLDVAAAQYEDQLRAERKWCRDAERWIGYLVEGIGPDRLLSEIGQDELRRHFARRAGRVAASSVNREIDVARPIWRMHEDTHHVGKIKWGRLRYSVPDVVPRELYLDEEERLWEGLRPDLRDFVRFALLSGWRLTEVRTLRWADLSLREGVAVKRIKGGEIVSRPLSTDMLTIIANQPKVGPFVFTYVCQKSRKAHIDAKGRKHPARLAGERYSFSADGWRKEWAAALEKAGIPSFRFHDLRHTRGTRILRHTGNLAAAQRALAHRNIKTTLRYAHAADDDVRRAYDASESRTIPAVPQTGDKERRKTAND